MTSKRTSWYLFLHNHTFLRFSITNIKIITRGKFFYQNENVIYLLKRYVKSYVNLIKMIQKVIYLYSILVFKPLISLISLKYSLYLTRRHLPYKTHILSPVYLKSA